MQLNLICKFHSIRNWAKHGLPATAQKPPADILFESLLLYQWLPKSSVISYSRTVHSITDYLKASVIDIVAKCSEAEQGLVIVT